MPVVLARLAEHSRRVAALVVARVLPGRSFPEVLDRVSRLPPRAQASFILSVLGILLAAALVAAQFGPPGLAVYFAAVVLLAR
jgi:hypothetical protein